MMSKPLAFTIGRILACAPLSLAMLTPALSQTEALEEVLVTATRQTSSINKVPLSITAASQEGLDEAGIKTIADLQRTAPALVVSPPTGGVQNFTIRGILSTQGAATTGVYLDDTGLQKRNVTGPAGNTTSNGTPAPPLFDLERVEVLRGPQGTLYGGSSQGGTVRFITPEPSLTEYTGLGRAEVSTVKDGGESYEAGFAMGGPIVRDKLGFRASVLSRHTAGYIDMVDAYNNGALMYEDANSVDTFSFRGALLWAPNDRTKATLSYFRYSVEDEGGPNQWTRPVDGTFTTTRTCYNTTRQFGQTPSPQTAVPCAPGGQSAQAPGIYLRDSVTYGPFPYLGRNKVFGFYKKSPVETETDVASFTFDYDLGDSLSFKSITAYLRDETNANSIGPLNEVSSNQRTTAFPGASGFALFVPVPDYAGSMITFNKRNGITQEFRMASAPDEGRFSYVAGVYYSNIRGHAEYCARNDLLSRITQPLWGLTVFQRYGMEQQYCNNTRLQWLDDNEIAGFGEGNLRLTDSLTAIAGARIARVEYSFYQEFFGTTTGIEVPTLANTGVTEGSVVENPLSPKYGLQYQITPNHMVYATAAKGYRAGGVNTPLTSICFPGLAAAGLTPGDIPTTYDSDTAWSYEAGAKLRLLGGRLQVNSSVYQIDWEDVQLTVSGLAQCPQNWVQNAGTATSKGFDLSTEANLFGGLSAALSVGYTKAEYTETSRAPAPPGSVGVPVVREGDTIPVPVWQGNLGLRYDFQLLNQYEAYVRGDYFYQGKYYRSPGAGVTQYAPDLRDAPSTRQVNARAGVNLGSWDVNLFVNNLLDSEDEVSRRGLSSAAAAGRTGCSIAQGAACTTFTSYDPFTMTGTLRPREIGVQTNYRF